MKKIYSGKGDQGTTSLLGESLVPKSHPRIRAVGALDEASAALGLARSTAGNEDLNQLIQAIQKDLYQIMSQIVLEKTDPEKFPDLPAERISWVEKMIEKYQKGLQDPKGFILPGDNPGSASLSLARTIIRRAEREIVELDQTGLLRSKTALPYINRLSSLCFVLELFTGENITPASSKSS
jgi:cob(I)alamin adenosyltransferase